MKPIVVFLRNRIEFVLMALRAVDSYAAKRSDGVRHHVIPVKVPGNLAVDLRFGNFSMSYEIPRTCRDKSQSLDTIARVGPEHVASYLLLDEARIRFVLIQRADHIVAIWPSVRSRFVFIVSVRVTIMYDIEPVPSPPLTILWHGEKFFYQPIQG